MRRKPRRMSECVLFGLFDYTDISQFNTYRDAIEFYGAILRLARLTGYV